MSQMMRNEDTIKVRVDVTNKTSESTPRPAIGPPEIKTAAGLPSR